MTVSFTPTNMITETMECICMTMYRTAGELLEGHDACPGYLPVGAAHPEFNLGNDNFEPLMALLGLPAGEFYGQLDAAELLACIAAARKKPHSEFARKAETPTTTTALFGGTGSALPAERFTRYLNELAAVAHYALEHGVTVSYN